MKIVKALMNNSSVYVKREDGKWVGITLAGNWDSLINDPVQNEGTEYFTAPEYVVEGSVRYDITEYFLSHRDIPAVSDLENYPIGEV